MAFHLKRILITFAILMMIIQTTRGRQDEFSKESEEENDSTSEETVIDSNVPHKQRRRSAEISLEENDVVGEGQPKVGLPPIPGLPDAETIRKIAEILTAVGQQVLPVFVSGNSGISDYVTNRLVQDMKFFKKFKSELKSLTAKLKSNK